MFLFFPDMPPLIVVLFPTKIKKTTFLCYKSTSFAFYIQSTQKADRLQPEAFHFIANMSAKETVKSPPVLSAFSRIGRRLRNMAGAMLGNDYEAEDALQDAFVKLWPLRERITTEEEAVGLLTTTVRHLSIDVLRRRQTERTIELDEEHNAPPDEEVAEKVEREHRFNTIEHIIAQELSPQTRDILRRHEFKGESYEDIAADLGMQPAAVRMHISRARKTIRECYLKLKEE